MWMSFRKRILPQLVLLILLSLSAAYAASPEPLALENKPSYDLSGYMETLSDPINQLTVEQAADQKDWTGTVRGQVPNLGFTRASIWLRFALTSQADTPRIFYVSFEYPVTQSVTFYTKDRHGVFHEESTGSSIPASANVLPDRNFVFPLTIGPDETKTAYLRVQSAARMILPVRVLSDQALLSKTIKDYTIY